MVNTTDSRTIIIIGGVAGGANAAARARRLSESARIIVFEKGPHVSFANCGLPYFIGGEIKQEEDLLLHTPQSLNDRFNLDVRVNSEVVRINRETKTVVVKGSDGHEYEERYDDLVIATGSTSLRPPIAGIDTPALQFVRTVPDVVAIKERIEREAIKEAVVVGGGYIGLEVVEQLRHRGLRVDIVEGGPQVMPPLDTDMAGYLHQELKAHGVGLYLSDPVVRFEQHGAMITVTTSKGVSLSAPLVILAIGVRPETRLAQQAGLTLTPQGSIKVNEYLQTSDPHIWAVGDCIATTDLITRQERMIPLAGPANRQGRLVADNIIRGEKKPFVGALGTSVLRLFSQTVAMTGANERSLRKEGITFKTIYLHPNSHAGYYPGAETIHFKVHYSPETHRLLGVQAVGKDGVEKRIDVLAVAIKAGMTVDEIADLELCYAPPFGSAKDPANMIGMMIQNELSGLVSNITWQEVVALQSSSLPPVILDVRSAAEHQRGAVPHALHIPLPQLRQRYAELPADREIVVHCQSGQRSYYACRILSQQGFRCRNISGGYLSYPIADGPSM